MKSYKAHLQSTSFLNQDVNIFRSSAIFPVFLNKHLNCKINFLSYWMIKKKIKEVSCVFSIRDKNGKIIIKRSTLITSTKNYEISLKDLLTKKNFVGSIEIEFFSSKNLVFPFPAVIINYLGKESSSFVHTCGRIYNNHQDKIENNKTLVPESGFDIFPDKIFKPFFSFVNGPEFLKNEKVILHLINFEGEILIKKINFKDIKEYETKFVFFLDLKEKNFFKHQRGTVRIFHNFKNFYPRFLSGNFTNDEKKVSLTHSYYDLSLKKNNDVKWLNPNKSIFFNPVVLFPFVTKNKLINELTVYPNFLKFSKIIINAELIDNKGKIVAQKQVLKISTKFNNILALNFNRIFKSNKIESDKTYFIRLILENNKGLPSRFKVGYNLSINSSQPSTNICFNATIPNKSILKKKSTFKWCAIINANTSLICLSNINYLKKKIIPASIKMTVWSDTENKKIVRKIKISNNGNLFLSFNKDKSVKKILKNNTGWVTFESGSPFLNGFYFDIKNKKSIAGDHLF
tara:strand:- start:283 stop:1827 length:1545 start_codon:yes stop_codon:yes gene_type:complete